jgi:hypothetical protein
MDNETRRAVNFPLQTVPDSKKTDEWAKDCIDAAENLYTFENLNTRATFYNKRINQNLRNNILNQNDVERIVNPSGVKISTNPDKIAHQGIANTKIMLLKGEESKRLQRKDFEAFVSSDEGMGVSKKADAIKNMYLQRMQELIMQEDLEEEQIEAELQKLQKYIKYSYKDIKEITANKILQYEYERLNLSDIITDCFEDLLTFGEEIAAVEEYGNDLVVRKVNPLNIFTVNSPESKFIEDSDVIIEYNYMSLRQILDLYYDEMSVQDFKDLEKALGSNNNDWGGMATPGFNRNITIEERFGVPYEEQSIGVTGMPGFFTAGMDHRGNIRVLRVCWRSSRKLGKLKYYDENGLPAFEIVPEQYKPDKSLGEEIEWFLVNEWWEGHKIANDKYVRMRPIPYQGRSEFNLSKCSPPYVGVVASFNNSRVMSLLDYLKPLDYMYDIVFYRYTLALSKYRAPITVINKSMIPTDIDPITFFNFVDSTGTMILDPTNEIMKGPSQGKSAGMFNTLTATVINSQMGDYVRQHIEMLQYIEQQIDTISGINAARQGNLDGKEKVGTSNMNWSASNSMTEPYFRIHSLFKKNLLAKMLNVAQYVWAKNPRKFQYVLDDFSAEILTDFEDISDVEFDIHVSHSGTMDEVKELMKQLSHAASQNGTITLSQVGQMYMKSGIKDTLRFLEEKEEELAQRQQQAQEAQIQAEQEAVAMQMEMEAAKLELEYEKLDREDLNKQLDRELAIQKEIIDAMGYARETDINNNQIPDVVEQGYLALEQQSMNYDIIDKQQQRQQEKQIKDKEFDLKKKSEDNKLKIAEINKKLKEKELAIKEKIEKIKLQVARTNKNKYDK